MLVIALFALILWLIFFPAKKKAAVAVISVNGQEFRRIALDSVAGPYELPLDCQPPLALMIERGCVYVLWAECPDKLCIRAGKLRKNGDTAVCLPAGVVVRLEAGEWLDAFTY
ncbi:MAG: NusG domain II-containing protein [Oscillospiraceae bacterium]|nr:NusG domain II-containing protein [Oscillospiraceae bacterium]